MFTGLIEGIGTLAGRESRGGDARLRIGAGTLPFSDIALGDSIAVNGVRNHQNRSGVLLKVRLKP